MSLGDSATPDEVRSLLDKSSAEQTRALFDVDLRRRVTLYVFYHLVVPSLRQSLGGMGAAPPNSKPTVAFIRTVTETREPEETAQPLDVALLACHLLRAYQLPDATGENSQQWRHHMEQMHAFTSKLRTWLSGDRGVPVAFAQHLLWMPYGDPVSQWMCRTFHSAAATTPSLVSLARPPADVPLPNRSGQRVRFGVIVMLSSPSKTPAPKRPCDCAVTNDGHRIDLSVYEAGKQDPEVQSAPCHRIVAPSHSTLGTYMGVSTLTVVDLGGLCVASVGNNFLFSCSNLTRVAATAPCWLGAVGKCAFGSCPKLTAVDFHNMRFTSVGDGFLRATESGQTTFDLSGLILPRVGKGMLGGYTKLTSVTARFAPCYIQVVPDSGDMQFCRDCSVLTFVEFQRIHFVPSDMEHPTNPSSSEEDKKRREDLLLRLIHTTPRNGRFCHPFGGGRSYTRSQLARLSPYALPTDSFQRHRVTVHCRDSAVPQWHAEAEFDLVRHTLFDVKKTLIDKASLTHPNRSAAGWTVHDATVAGESFSHEDTAATLLSLRLIDDFEIVLNTRAVVAVAETTVASPATEEAEAQAAAPIEEETI